MIYRKEKHKVKFTILDNELINDPRLSFKALGLLVYYLSKPPHWKIRKEELYNARGVGRRYIESAFEELIAYGYMVQEDGDWNIYETPRRAQNVPPGQNAQGDIEKINPSEDEQKEQDDGAKCPPETVQNEHSDRGAKVLTISPSYKDYKNNMGSVLRKGGGSHDVFVDSTPRLVSDSSNVNRDSGERSGRETSREVATNRPVSKPKSKEEVLAFLEAED